MHSNFVRKFLLVFAAVLIAFAISATLRAQPGNPASPWPMFGGAPGRNMVNLVDKNIPTDWSVEEGKLKNVKWMAELGSKAYGGPVVADGKVFVGINDYSAKKPEVSASKAVLMCIDEASGKVLWQNVHATPANSIFNDARTEGLCSTPTVDGKRVYYVTPACVAICADTANGNILWQLDMMKDLHVVPYHLGNCSPLVIGDLVMLLTGNGVSSETGKVVSPQAPSFLALKKSDGHVVWQSNLPGENIQDGQWSNPTLAVINGKEQVLFPGGDGFIYSFEAQTGKLLWQCNGNPRPPVKPGERKVANYFVSTPVVVGNRVYVGLGLYPEHPVGTKFSHFLCLDATKSGDVSLKSQDAKDQRNKDSALVWSYGGLVETKPKQGRSVIFGRTISTAAVHDGLVYISEENGYLHCLDAATGQKYWVHDFKTNVWGSPYFVDGRIYIGTDDGEVVILQHGKTAKVINKIDMGEVIHSTPVVASGVLYILTTSKLYAIGK